jgi:hypothetical protein
MRNGCETQSTPDLIHLFEVPDDRTIIFFPVFFEKKDSQQLVLSVIPSRIFAGIQRDPRRLNNRKRMFDKTDKPARRFLICLLMVTGHNKIRRHRTLDLLVRSTRVSYS